MGNSVNDSVWDKNSHDYFSTMSPQDAIIRSPTGAIIYDAAILRDRYGICAVRERTMMGMKKGVVTLKTMRVNR